MMFSNICRPDDEPETFTQQHNFIHLTLLPVSGLFWKLTGPDTQPCVCVCTCNDGDDRVVRGRLLQSGDDLIVHLTGNTDIRRKAGVHVFVSE